MKLLLSSKNRFFCVLLLQNSLYSILMNFDLIFPVHYIRDNITDEEPSSSEVAEFHGYKERKTNLSIGDSSSSIPLQGRSDAATSKKSQEGDTDKAQPSWDPNWHSLFELMNEIACRRTEENVKLEAVSIMNIIVMRTNAYTERET